MARLTGNLCKPVFENPESLDLQSISWMPLFYKPFAHFINENHPENLFYELRLCLRAID